MGALINSNHERFCQAYHKRVCAGERRSIALSGAYREAIYEGKNGHHKAIAPNARRLVQRKDVASRLAELADYSAKLANIDAAWALVELARRVDRFNLDDYMTPREKGKDRFFDISACTPDQLAKLSELTLEDETDEGGRRLRKTKLKPYDPAAIIGLMARIAGWEAPKKIAPTTPEGEGLTLEGMISASFERGAK
jgi:hypothetical protein